ncbi:VWA domain-containing protein [Solibacillus silvestris]|uniref:VWA domain-containing protein n=1 Tax=Solibacillus silvestris TaxID=76853 RepID=UPI003F810183
MKTLIRGEKVKLADHTNMLQLEVEVSIQAPFEIDFTCFGLNEQRQLQDDRYMVFYNQLQSPNNEIRLQNGQGKSNFAIDLSKLPPTVPYLVFTATIDGNQMMNQIEHGSFIVKANNSIIMQYQFSPSDFQQQKAIIIGEIYYKSLWRIASVGQGFDGGLAALLTSFGGVMAEEPAVEAPVNDKKVQLEKRLEKEAPHLLDLSKKALVSLEKVGLQQHQAKVALCLDISGSMSSLYASGKIQHFIERILALATRFDDNGSIDIFLFGKNAHDAGELTIANNQNFLGQLLKTYPLEGSTYYSKAITLIRKHYIGSSSHRKKPAPQDIPVYVMFVTDGDTFDRDQTTKQIVNASFEPIFWQFMAIDETRKGLFGRSRQSQFKYLEELDTLEGRYIDNAGFFSVQNPAAVADNELYDLLMEEYPQWIKEAKMKGLLLG